jgi:hypothetical protein
MLKTKPRRTREPSSRVLHSTTRRTTVSLPEELLKKVERFAATRHQTVSSAITYLVESALRNEPGSLKDSRGILEMWRKSFLGLTEDEQLLVDGIILEKPGTTAE